MLVNQCDLGPGWIPIRHRHLFSSWKYGALTPPVIRVAIVGCIHRRISSQYRLRLVIECLRYGRTTPGNLKRLAQSLYFIPRGDSVSIVPIFMGTQRSQVTLPFLHQ